MFMLNGFFLFWKIKEIYFHLNKADVENLLCWIGFFPVRWKIIFSVDLEGVQEDSS